MAVAAGGSGHITLSEQFSMDAPCELVAYPIMAFSARMADICLVYSGGRIRGRFYGVAAVAVTAICSVSLGSRPAKSPAVDAVHKEAVGVSRFDTIFLHERRI